MESQALVKTCEPHSKRSESQSKSGLIRESIAKLALNAGQALDTTALAVYQTLWEEGFEDLPYGVLEAAFRKTLRECKFWPVKIADIREHVDRTKETAVTAAADLEWQRVLDLRRMYWSPDMPGGFSRGMPKLAERVDRAVRASGVFKLQDCEPEALHVWAKKRFIESYLAWAELEQEQFIESYLAWAELEQEQFLLPDGELKDLLAGVAETKALPESVSFTNLHARGLAYEQR
jgi:hypothetical protein